MTVGEAQAAHDVVMFIVDLGLWELRARTDANPDRIERVAEAALTLAERSYVRLGAGPAGPELRRAIRDALGLDES